MATDFGTFVIFFILIFGSLEIAFVVIPAMVGRSKVGMHAAPVFDIPDVISIPVPADYREKIRAWYFDDGETYRYDRSLPKDKNQNSNPVEHVFPALPVGFTPHTKDWKAINKANWAIQRANEAVREANRAIQEANAAIEEAGGEETEWMDSIAGIGQYKDK